MIKTVITPQNDSYMLTIPQNYIGKKVEVLLYALDELTEKKEVVPKKPSDFFGSLTQEEGDKFQAYISKSREEWNRGI
jgi:hypothetical protein